MCLSRLKGDCFWAAELWIPLCYGPNSTKQLLLRGSQPDETALSHSHRMYSILDSVGGHTNYSDVLLLT